MNTIQSPLIGNTYTQSSRVGAQPSKSEAAEASKAAEETSQASGIQRVPKLSAKQVADNILAHVARGIDALKSEGASAERIQARIDAAKEGVEKGYAEATDMLKSLGMLDDALQQEIDAGRKMVDERLANLANPDDLANLDGVTSSRYSTFDRENSLSMDVVTREGDRVTVYFKQSQSAQSAQLSNNNASGVAFSATEQRQFDFEVEGSLNAREQKALAALFDDVAKLGDQFFNGNIGEALSQAMNLGFDTNELASMSVNLTQVTVSSRLSAYQATQPDLPTDALESVKSPLAAYVDSYKQTLEDMEPFSSRKRVMDELLSHMWPDQAHLQNMLDFNEALSKQLGLD